jgi:hypothetical protein
MVSKSFGLGQISGKKAGIQVSLFWFSIFKIQKAQTFRFGLLAY